MTRLFRSQRRLRAWIWRLRFVVAAICCGAAASTAAHVARPPAPATTEVVVAARTLATGTVLATADLTVVHLPPSTVPDGAHGAVDDLIGRSTVTQLTPGVPLVEVLVGRRGPVAAAPQDTVVAAIRLDPALAGLLSAGDRIDVLSIQPSQSPEPTGDLYVARAAVVMPAPENHGAGLLGDGALESGVVLVAVQPHEAEQIAAHGWADLTAVLVR